MVNNKIWRLIKLKPKPLGSIIMDEHTSQATGCQQGHLAYEISRKKRTRIGTWVYGLCFDALSNQKAVNPPFKCLDRMHDNYKAQHGGNP